MKTTQKKKIHKLITKLFVVDFYGSITKVHAIPALMLYQLSGTVIKCVSIKVLRSYVTVLTVTVILKLSN